MLSKLRPRNKDALPAKENGRLSAQLKMPLKRLSSTTGTQLVKVNGTRPAPSEMLAKLRPRNKDGLAVKASPLAGIRRRVHVDDGTKRVMLEALDRSTLDNVQGANRKYCDVVTDKMDGVCLREIWVLIIEFRQASDDYHVIALLPPVGHVAVNVPPTAADLQLASGRVEFTVPLAVLQASLVALLKNGRLTMWMQLRDVVITQQFLDAVRPALEELFVDSTTLSLNGVTCNVDHGHAKLIHMLNGVHRVDMGDIGHFQPNDLDDAFLRCSVTHACRAFIFPEGAAATRVTDKAILELCFDKGSYDRQQRILHIDGPTLSTTFVRDVIQRHLSCDDNVSIYASITVTPPPQRFDEVEQYRAIGHDANTFGGFEFHVYSPTFMLIRWWPMSGKMTIQRHEGRLF